MTENDERRLAEDSPPRMVMSQRCSEEFDWREDTCPNCGWDKRAWIDNGRYGLQLRHAE